MALGSLRHEQLNEKFSMFSFRRACRSISNHPFFLFMLLFLIGLHQYFPFLFSLLVSASPVVICTAVVLGALLIHGQPNNNNVKFHEELSTGATVRMKVEEHHPYYANREGIFSRDRFAEVRNDIVEKGMRASGMLGSGIRVNTSNVTNEADEYCNVELSKVSKIHEEKSKNDFGYDKTIEVNEDFGMQDKLKSSLGEKKGDDNGDHHEYEDNVDEFSENESDGVEKSSFDALVADVIPTAQETHPLLDSEEALHVDASKNVSLLNFEFQSLDSNQSSEDSGKDDNDNDDVNDENMKGKDDGNVIFNAWIEMEKNQQLESLITKSNDERDHGEVEVEDDYESIEDDDDDDDEEQDNQNLEKDVRTNRVTIWTEEDEKNLRLVGNSELERDLRLENLLARRRAKRNFSMISERNLIDLDRPILPFPVTPISTTRVNPFENPIDSKQQHDSSIPPIPGSAPPVRVANKNPFDSPCTSPKEESLEVSSNNGVFHENGSGSGSSSIGYSSKGKVLRKHETFSTRSEFHSSLDTIQRPYSFRMRPFFVPEHVVGDEDERHSSLSHDSESVVSSSDSDHTESSSIAALDEDVGPIKDVTVEGDPGEEFVISLEVNTEVHGDQSHDNVSSSTSSVTSEDDHVLEDEDEDEVVSESGFSTKASSNGTIEPPAYDSSPVMEKSTPFSSTHSD